MKSRFLKKLLLLLLIPFALSMPTLGLSEKNKDKESSKKMLSDFSGNWKNQRGSALFLEKTGNNTYTGTFTTAVATTKTCIGEPVPVVAVNNGNSLSISSSMESCGSPVTLSISGLLREKEPGKEAIETQAFILKNGEEAWNSRNITHDSYARWNGK